MAESGGSGPGSETSRRAPPPRISAAASASTSMTAFPCLQLQFALPLTGIKREESREFVEIRRNFSEMPSMSLDLETFDLMN